MGPIATTLYNKYDYATYYKVDFLGVCNWWTRLLDWTLTWLLEHRFPHNKTTLWEHNNIIASEILQYLDRDVHHAKSDVAAVKANNQQITGDYDPDAADSQSNSYYNVVFHTYLVV